MVRIIQPTLLFLLLAPSCVTATYKVITQRFAQTMELKPNYSQSTLEAEVKKAAAKVVPAYNTLQKSNNDPLKRSLTNAQVTKVGTPSRRLQEEDGAYLAQDEDMAAALRGSRNLRTHKVTVDVEMTLYGVCKNCKSGDRLISDVSYVTGNRRHRRLSAIPSKSVLRKEQNKEINKSNNPTVNHVSELWAKAMSLAAEARKAEANAEVQEAYLEDAIVELEKKEDTYKDLVSLREKLVHDREKAEKKVEELLKKDDPELKSEIENMKKTVDDLERQIESYDREIKKIDRLIRKMEDDVLDIKDEVKSAKDYAEDLKKKAHKAEEEARKAEEEAQKAEKDAQKAEEEALKKELEALKKSEKEAKEKNKKLAKENK